MVLFRKYVSRRGRTRRMFHGSYPFSNGKSARSDQFVVIGREHAHNVNTIIMTRQRREAPWPPNRPPLFSQKFVWGNHFSRADSNNSADPDRDPWLYRGKAGPSIFPLPLFPFNPPPASSKCRVDYFIPRNSSLFRLSSRRGDSNNHHRGPQIIISRIQSCIVRVLRNERW